jgi:Tfp pilus assembly protein PilF
MILRLLKDLFGGAAGRARAEKRRLAASSTSDRGIASRGQGRLKDAYADLTRAVELAPNDAHALYAVAEVAELIGERARAAEYCRQLRRGGTGPGRGPITWRRRFASRARATSTC